MNLPHLAHPPALLALLVLPLPCPAAPPARAPHGGFTDVTAPSGLRFTHHPGVDGSYFVPESIGAGGALFDYDGDGDLDVYLVDGGPHGGSGDARRPPNRLFRQEGDGTFVDVTAASGLGDRGYGMGVAVGDIDNDGDPDVYVTNDGPDALYRNNGDGTFTEVTAAAGIDEAGWGSSAVFFDYDGDGLLDLYVADYLDYDPAAVCADRAGRPDYCGPAGFPGAVDHLFHNLGNDRFADVSAAAGIAAVARKGLGVVAADLTGDGLPDLYVADDGEANLLWANRGDGTFEDRALSAGVAVNELGRPEAGMGIALGDADGDGILDLFVSHLRGESNTLYRRLAAVAGDAPFEDATGTAGLAGPSLPWTGFGTALIDADLDGDLDLVVVDGRVTRGPLLTTGRPASYWDDYAEPAFLFENDGHGRFHDAGPGGGDLSTTVGNARGLATGDLDGDGDVDLLVTYGGGRARLFRNDLPRRGAWLSVRLLDAAHRRDAAGALLTVVAGGRRRIEPVAPGGSFLSASDPRVPFGLGEANGVDELQVRWPGGGETRFRELPADRFLRIVWPAPSPPPPREPPREPSP